MKTTKLLVTIFVLLALATVYFLIDLNMNISEQLEKPGQVSINKNSQNCTPTFKDGGGPYYLPDSPFREKIVPEINNGQRLIVKGRVLVNDCITPVPNAILDIWQANELGSYEDEWYRGQVKTDSLGNYVFETVVPKGYGEGTGYRPPHIHFKVFMGEHEIVTSQMFFPEIKGTDGFDDAYIMKIETIAENGTTFYKGNHDIILP